MSPPRPLPYREAIRIDLANAIYGRGLRPLARWLCDETIAVALSAFGFREEARALLRSPNRPVNLPRIPDGKATPPRP